MSDTNHKNLAVRFAPSPTGYLHIGGARTALFNYLFAKNKNAKFLLRIEDTDEKRSTKEAIDAILQGLDWLGLKHDGEYVLQSKNLARHKKVAEELLENGKAYLCYTSAEELTEKREAAEKKGEIFRFKSEWRDKINSQTSTVKPVIRIKAPLDGECVIKDLVQGEVKVANSEIDDLVMLRGDGPPTYMLAVVVDDHDMEISHIIRGDDHLTNAFRQKIIYEACGWTVPEFAHIPLIHGADGAKMSKRHGATSVIEYKDLGYLPEALRNYLLRLGWSHGDSEIISDQEAREWFNLEKIGKSPSRFDFAKLNHVNKHYIKEKNDGDLFELTKEFFEKNCFESEKTRIIKAIKFSKERASTLKELAESVKIYFEDSQANFSEEDKKIFAEKKDLIIDLQAVLNGLESYNHDGIKNSLAKYCETKSIKIKDFGPLLRLILTFSNASAGGIFDVVEVLGKDLVIKRIAKVL